MDFDIVPLFDYQMKEGEFVGLQYSPIFVANKCRNYFSIIQDSYQGLPLDEWHRRGLYTAKIIELEGTHYPEYSIYDYNFRFPQENLNPPWVDALTQSAIADCYRRAYVKTNDTKYLDLGEKALMAIRIPYDNSTGTGFMVDESNSTHKMWWYLHYPHQDQKASPFVLNGMQYTVLYLHDFLQFRNTTDLQEAFENGLMSLKDKGAIYDNGTNNSYYDRLQSPANKYHDAHVTLWQWLYDRTGDTAFLELKNLFEN